MTIQDKFREGFRELITMCMDGGLTTWEMLPIIDGELATLRLPYQNPEDNDAS